MRYKGSKKNKIWLLAYPLLAAKELIFYWQTDRLDMMGVFPVALLTYIFLLAIYELFYFKDSSFHRKSFYIIYGLITLLFFADAAYSSYFGQYASVNQLFQLGSLGQIAKDGAVLEASVNPLCILCLADYPLMIWIYGKRMQGKEAVLQQFMESVKDRKLAGKRKTLFARGGALLFHIVLFTAAGYALWFYGSNPMDNREILKINHIEIFSYHVNDLIVNVGGKLHRKQVNEEEIQKVMKENIPASQGETYKGVAKGMNLILIQVESLNDFVIGKSYNGQEITPFINQMLKEDTLYFNHFYSTTGVGNTSDAEFSTLNSLYANTERECYRRYVDNTFNGLPWLLRQEGYEALAFHGYLKTFWNRDEAYKNQGFERFYSQDDFDLVETSGFGLTDKELFRQSVEILQKKKEPFFSFMITLTNHIPYELDASMASLELKENDKKTTFGRYLQTVRYTDEAIEYLVKLLKAKGMYENTMIVFYGDHQGLNKETPAVQYSMTSYLGRTYDFDEMLNVPLVIHIPGLGEARTIETVGGEVDTLPTIANLMDLDLSLQPYIFGHDLLNAKEGFLAQISYIGIGSFISGPANEIFAIGKDGSVESGRAIDLRNGRAMNASLPFAISQSERALTLINTCKEVLDYNLIANYVVH